MSKLDRNYLLAKYGESETLNKLETLDIEVSELEEIDSSTFIDLPNLKELKVHNYNLKRINANAFKGLVNLKKLLLLSSQIDEINIDAFVDLTDLKELWLYGVDVKIIDRSCFKPLKSIAIVALYGNEINLKFVSYFNKSILNWSDRDKLFMEKKFESNGGFESDWKKFLLQFPGKKFYLYILFLGI